MFCPAQIRPKSLLLLLFFVVGIQLFPTLQVQGCKYIMNSLSLSLKLRIVLGADHGSEGALFCFSFCLQVF